MSYGKATSTREARRALFDDAAAIIDADYGRELEVDEVARQIATSRRQLQRVFAEIAGTTFSDYLRRVRLERAAEMLCESRRPLPEIAAAVGFRSPTSFSVAFRRHHGVPPSALRPREG